MKTVIHIRTDITRRSTDRYHSLQVTYCDQLNHRKQTLSLFFLIMNNVLCIIQFTDLLPPSPFLLFSFLSCLSDQSIKKTMSTFLEHIPMIDIGE